MNKLPIFIFFLICSYIGINSDALSQAKLKSMVGIKGECIKSSIAGLEYNCKNAVYTHLSNKRTMIIFSNDEGTLAFSGGSDSQIMLEKYTLGIDTIRVTRGASSEPTSYKANGKCEFRVNKDGSHVYSINCDAKTSFDITKIRFKGASNPINTDIMNIPNL